MSDFTNYFLNKRSEMTRFLPDDFNRILEIGCGEGIFSKDLDNATERWGVEPNRVSAEKASHVMTKVLTGTYEDVLHDLPDNYFDLVICNDVIEHMADTDFFFRTIRDKLVCNGAVTGSIPNIRHFSILIELLINKDWRYLNSGILDNTHLRFFTEISIKRTIRNHNFDLIRFSGINSSKYSKKFYKRVLKTTAFSLLTLLTLGYYEDIQFPQFGFLIRKKS